ncbi:MAG: acyl-CoA dehydrogenase family protein [Ktedonobacteraceae bacterium]
MAFPLYPATERQTRILAMADELAERFLPRANEGEWEGRFPYENYRDLHESGYLRLTVPREFGGWGADIVEVALAQARLAQGCPSTALVTTMHLSFLGRIAAGHASNSPTFERICRAVVEQGALINSAVSEPATGSPSRGGRLTTTARRQADGSWLLNGRKTYSTGSVVMQFFLVGCSIEDDAPASANLPPLNGTRGNLLVPCNMPGVRIEETWNSLGMRLSASHDLILENVHLEAEALTNLLDIPNEVMSIWGLPLAALYLGIAQGARNEAVRFAKSRRPNSLNQSIASVPHIQEKVAKMDLALLQSEAVLFGLAEQVLRDPASIPASQYAAAKYLATNHALEVTDLAMRLVGGAALSLNLPLQRYYRDVRAGFNNPPMDDVTLTMLSKQAFGEA